ncbi:MAG TPA: carboxymuconolactone decarboxylase family protein [Spongiibacteraceae bacterium]|nr:carboxymuconolactone decarboxylase family protein [Spongiibacteraceae bacterium]
MSTLDPKTRTQRGASVLSDMLGMPAPQPTTLLDSVARDFVCADVWSRPGLDRRARFFVAIATSACVGGSNKTLEGYIHGALHLGEITLGELREAALQVAVYAGWGIGAALDEAITRVANTMGLEPVAIEPLQSEPQSAQQRLEIGQQKFTQIAVVQAPPPVTPFFDVGILNFVFGELWTRPGLDQRGRRLVTLACAATSSATTPIRSHTYAALATGDITPDEMQEFVLQFAVDAGWPKGAVLQVTVFEMGKRVANGLPFE